MPRTAWVYEGVRSWYRHGQSESEEPVLALHPESQANFLGCWNSLDGRILNGGLREEEAEAEEGMGEEEIDSRIRGMGFRVGRLMMEMILGTGGRRLIYDFGDGWVEFKG